MKRLQVTVPLIKLSPLGECTKYWLNYFLGQHYNYFMKNLQFNMKSDNLHRFQDTMIMFYRLCYYFYIKFNFMYVIYCDLKIYCPIYSF